ncbi:MAG TPA: GntR family transcriptional regulator [Bacillota bacterium]|nr:GntR family transcriptional regulator [Bacillota bacterium]
MKILISNSSKKPLFQQIKEQIKQKIHTGELQEGDALPSMRKLAKDLKVSVITTKRAYEDLETEGYLVSAVGRGTFVAGQAPHVLWEWQLRELENDLEALVREARRIGLSKTDFLELVNIYYEEESR